MSMRWQQNMLLRPVILWIAAVIVGGKWSGKNVYVFFLFKFIRTRNQKERKQQILQEKIIKICALWIVLNFEWFFQNTRLFLVSRYLKQHLLTIETRRRMMSERISFVNKSTFRAFHVCFSWKNVNFNFKFQSQTNKLPSLSHAP